MIGYRGGKITERPEKLKNEIKTGKIMQFDDFKKMFDDFIVNILNKMPSNGKVLQGKCPDELYEDKSKNDVSLIVRLSSKPTDYFCMSASETKLALESKLMEDNAIFAVCYCKYMFYKNN